LRNDLSGSAMGPVLQVGALHGDVRFGGAASGDTWTPWQLPPPVRIIDRVAEVEWLDRLRKRAQQEDRPALVVVSGLGGVGKSVLSLSWLHRLRPHFPDGQLYADLVSPGGPVEPAEVLGRFLRGLGVAPERIPAAVDERVALYRSCLAGRRLVALLDNAVSAAQVRPLLAGGQNVVVVTSRRRLPGLAVDGCSALQLEPLGTDDAVELLRFTLDDDRVRQEPAGARVLVDLCAGLPLAVRVAGARLATRPRRPITAMVLALKEERGRLKALAIEGDHNVTAALDLSYQGLPDTARRLYRRLGLHPGPHFGEGVARAAAGRESAPDAPDLLDQLLDASLLTEAGADGYRFHDLVRLHAAGRAREDETPEEAAAALRRILDYHLASATNAEAVLDPHHRSLPREFGPEPVDAEDFAGDADAALRWLEDEQANLIAVARQARQTGHPRVTWQLVDAMWPLFTRRKHYDLWRAAHEEGLAAARECGDTAAQCRMLTSGGLGELDTGGHDRALAMFEEAAELFRESGDALGHARTLNYRGLAYQGLGRLDEAADVFARAAVECPRCGDVRAGGLARLNLADVALARGRHEEAAGHAAEARRVLLEHADPYNAARAATLLGRAHLGTGDAGAAEEHLGAALGVLHGMTAGFETARALEGLAEVAEARGLPELAAQRYREALGLYTALQAPAADAVRARLGRLG
jgi:tetratricopeptide (TPR) repeat protein